MSKINLSENLIKFNKEATCFNDSLLLGNGRMGAIVYGGIQNEKISLNEDSLWSGSHREIPEKDYPKIRKQAIKLFEKGEKIKAQRLVEQEFGGYLNQLYLPLADIIIKQENCENASGYSRSLRLDKAVHTVKYSSNGCTFKREAFVSEPYQVMAVCFSASKDVKITFTATLEGRLKSDCFLDNNAVILEGTTPVTEPKFGTCTRSADEYIYDGKGVSYRAAIKVKTEGGSVEYQNNCISVNGANSAVLYFAVRTNFERFDIAPNGDEYKARCLADIDNAIDADYSLLKKRSIASHAKLYNKCVISLNGTNSRTATDNRLKNFKKGREDIGLYPLLFNFGKYLTISASRKGTQPTNLQGIWNDKIVPPWSSNYTTNINTEMNYWPTLAMGLFDCYEPFIRFVEELSQTGAKTAKQFYGVDGWVSHHNSDLWRLSHPSTNCLQNNAQWGFWSMSSGWFSVMLWNYYRYTLDKKYLKRIYPIIEGSARFYKKLLVEDNGELIFPLTTSPENNFIENGEVIAVDKSTAMTQEIIYDLFTCVAKAQQILGKKDRYSSLIGRLKMPKVMENGELCEWHSEHEVWDVHHRHVSHLYGLFPAAIFDEKQKQGARNVLLSRGDGGTGWSLAWKINLWARLGDAEHALTLLNNQLKMVDASCDSTSFAGGSYPNLLCAHPPFQIDGNFGAANGIIEMLLQYDEKGNPIMLPALPQSWKSGCVKNLRLPNKRSISFCWENGKIKSFEIKENVKC